jgi:hypothetical protein
MGVGGSRCQQRVPMLMSYHPDKPNHRNRECVCVHVEGGTHLNVEAPAAVHRGVGLRLRGKNVKRVQA